MGSHCRKSLAKAALFRYENDGPTAWTGMEGSSSRVRHIIKYLAFQEVDGISVTLRSILVLVFSFFHSHYLFELPVSVVCPGYRPPNHPTIKPYLDKEWRQIRLEG